MDPTAKKQQLLSEIAKVDKGVIATQEDKKRIDVICGELEEMNPTEKPLASELINGRWKLLYTTSASILGTDRPALLRPRGYSYQIIDAPGLRAKNTSGLPLFAEVTADLTAVSDSRVDVKFDMFKILKLIPFKAGPDAKGWLETTYLDEELRISRGDKGNLFVLEMDDPSAKP